MTHLALRVCFSDKDISPYCLSVLRQSLSDSELRGLAEDWESCVSNDITVCNSKLT